MPMHGTRRLLAGATFAVALAIVANVAAPQPVEAQVDWSTCWWYGQQCQQACVNYCAQSGGWCQGGSYSCEWGFCEYWCYYPPTFCQCCDSSCWTNPFCNCNGKPLCGFGCD